ncbi:MAG: diguanylate cyclase [Chloroflexi bacterium]|nr:diguanylate cyclase [Chloroflexota bacterium]
MELQNHPFALYSALAAAVAGICAVIALQRRHTPGALALGVLLLAVMEWALCYSLEIASVNFPVKLFWAKMQYLGLVWIPALWLAMALEFSGLGRWLTRGNIAASLAIPILTILLAFTNDAHGLIWEHLTIEAKGELVLMRPVYGLGFRFFVAYTYLLIVLGIIAFAWMWARSPRLYRAQAAIFTLGALFPIAGNLVYLSGILPASDVDFTPVAFTVSGLLFVIGIYRYHMLDIAPLARDAALDSMSDGVILLDVQGRVVDINLVARDLLALPAGQAVGIPLTQVLPQLGDALALASADRAEAQEFAYDRSGETRALELRVSDFKDAQKVFQGYVAVIRDVTEQRQAAEAVQRREQILEATTYAAEIFLRTPRWDDNIQGVLRRLGEAAQVSRCYLFENHAAPDGTILTSQRFEWAAQGVETQLDNPDLQDLPWQASGFGRWAEALSRGKTIQGLVEDFPEQERELLLAQGIISLLAVPVFVEHQWWGMIGFDDCRTRRMWESVELDVLQVAASTLGAAIERRIMEEKLHRRAEEITRLYAAEMRRGDELDALRATVADITGELDLPKLLRSILERAVSLLDAAGGDLALYHPEWHDLEVVVSYNLGRDYTGTRLAVGEGAIGRAVETYEAVLVRDYRSWDGRSQQYDMGNWRAVLATPLTIGGRVLGAVAVVHSDVTRQFTHHDVNLLTAFAQQAAIAIDNAHNFEEMQLFARRMALLNDITRVAISAPDLPTMLNRLADRLSEMFNAGGAYIALGSRPAPATLPLQILGLDAAQGVDLVSDGDLHVGPEGIRAGNILLADDGVTATASPRIVAVTPDRMIMGMPLIADGRRLGTAYVSNFRRSRMTADDLALAEQASSQVALALARALSLESEKQGRQELARANSIIIALGHVAARIEMAPDPDAVMETLGGELAKLGMRCLVALQSPKQGGLTIRYASLPPKNLALVEKIIGMKLSEMLIIPKYFPFYEEVIERHNARFLENSIDFATFTLPRLAQERLPRLAKAIEVTPKTHWIFLPLVSEEHVRGSLWLWGEDLEEAALPAAAVFASQVAVALDNARLYAEVQQSAITDELTGLYNRRGFFELGRREVERSLRYARPLSAVFLDIDHFKQVNDRYGHQAGDQVLYHLAECLRQHVRSIDIVGRYGGEEFVLLLPETDQALANGVAERLRVKVEEMSAPTARGPVAITVSVGIAALTEAHENLEALLAHADQGLYRAKQTGRNRVVSV